jgi:hypothetical protein
MSTIAPMNKIIEPNPLEVTLSIANPPEHAPREPESAPPTPKLTSTRPFSIRSMLLNVIRPSEGPVADLRARQTGFRDLKEAESLAAAEGEKFTNPLSRQAAAARRAADEAEQRAEDASASRREVEAERFALDEIISAMRARTEVLQADLAGLPARLQMIRANAILVISNTTVGGDPLLNAQLQHTLVELAKAAFYPDLVNVAIEHLERDILTAQSRAKELAEMNLDDHR